MTLRTHQLTVAIQNKIICQDLDFTAQPGEVWGILGANGSGKTTMLHTLAGLHPAPAGKIFLHQQPIAKLANKSVAQSVAILFQDNSDTFPQSVWEFCSAGRFPHLSYFSKPGKQDKDIIASALQVMDLDSYSNKNIQHLSGGEKRRLAIAAVLAQTPDVYLLDEPTNHLDVHYQVKTLQHFHHLAKTDSAAIVMSLHDVNLAQQYCSHILMLFNDGSILQGTMSDIMTRENLSRLYCHPMLILNDGKNVFWHPAIDM